MEITPITLYMNDKLVICKIRETIPSFAINRNHLFTDLDIQPLFRATTRINVIRLPHSNKNWKGFSPSKKLILLRKNSTDVLEKWYKERTSEWKKKKNRIRSLTCEANLNEVARLLE